MADKRKISRQQRTKIEELEKKLGLEKTIFNKQIDSIKQVEDEDIKDLERRRKKAQKL